MNSGLVCSPDSEVGQLKPVPSELALANRSNGYSVISNNVLHNGTGQSDERNLRDQYKPCLKTRLLSNSASS